MKKPENIPTWNYPSSGIPIYETDSASRIANTFDKGGKGKKKNKTFSTKELVEYMVSEGITNPRAQANILAQLEAESSFTPKTEKLNYSPGRLYEVFPNKFKNLEEAKQIVKQGQKAIGNKIYGNRMGNNSDEGYTYRGRGLIQLTGKDNYKKYGELIGKDLVNNPELANDPEIAKQLSIAYFKSKEINLADVNQINDAVGYKKSPGERIKRDTLTNKYYSEMGVEDRLPVEVAGKKQETKIQTHTPKPSISANTISYKPDLNKLNKAMTDWKDKKHTPDSELYPQYNNAEVVSKKNPEIVDNLYLKPPKNVSFGKLPKLDF